ncbi:MAG: glycosyltransferase, partial [Elusimicrobiota bacterium]
MYKPIISVIIPVKNGEKTIGKCLESVFNLDWPDFEVIVVNDGSTDSTAKILNDFSVKHKNMKIITTPGLGPSDARNLAIKEASGEFIAFTDGDCTLDRNWPAELHNGFSNDKIAGVGGDQLSPEDDTQFGKTVAGFLKTIGFVTGYIKPAVGQSSGGKNCPQGMPVVDHNPTCCVMYRKKIFEEAGGFYSGLWPGEDVEFDRRLSKLGYRHIYNPQAKVYHYRPQNIRSFSKMMYSYGRVQSWLVRKFGFFRKIHFVPPVMIGGSLVWLAVTLKAPLIGMTAALAVAAAVFIRFKTLDFFLLFIVTVFSWH